MDLKVTRETSTQYREGIYICKVPQMLCGRNGAETQACLIPELVFFLCNVALLGRCWLVNSSAQQTVFLYQCLQRLAIWPWDRAEMCMVGGGRLPR